MPRRSPTSFGNDAASVRISHTCKSAACARLAWPHTNNLIPSDQHLTIAWGRDYDDISPIKGVILGGGTHTMTIAVDVAAAPV
ncbi:MAG: hypothetical protein HY289_04440 [Planctomycetes bacterium]|nr:hypothetical protein [Planctomycetota bacterium]